MSELASCIFRKKSCHVIISTDSALSKTFLLLPIQCSPLIEYYRTIAHARFDNKIFTSSYSGGTIHQWLWKAVPYPYTVWEEGMPIGWSSDIWDKKSCYVTSSYRGCSIQIKRWYCYKITYYSVHHYSFRSCPSLG